MTIATEVSNADLLDRRSQAVARGVASAHPIFAHRADGVRLWDVEGREYLDFAGGIGTLNVGHHHPRLVAAIREQLERFTHTCFQVVPYEPYVELAERLNALAPGDFPKKTLLLSTGAEATENAVKIARHATGRPGVIAFRYAFHGRTLLALTMTGKTTPYRQNFGPWAPDVYHAPFPHALHGIDSEQALDGLGQVFETQIAPERVAAIIVEPVLGEGGFVPAPAPFLRALREMADRHGIVFIADEVQSGFGRTGTMFAIEHAGVAPDIIVLAKSIAGGLPLAAVVGRADIIDAVAPGGLGGTFGGNPVACAAALATLDVFADGELFRRAQAIGGAVRARLESLQRRHAEIAEVRALGAMVAMELRERASLDGSAEHAQRIVAAARERGVILLTCGPGARTIRFLIPLVASDADVALGLDRFEGACSSVLSSQETRTQNS